MHVAGPRETVFQLGCGVFWTAAYVLIIYRAYRDKTPVMPLAAACTNISWEFIFSFIYPHGVPQLYINEIWLVLDVIIFAQTLVYLRSPLPRQRSAALLYAGAALGLVVSSSVVINMTREFKDWDSMYSAFGMNLVMSVLFVTQLNHRDSLAGQSIYIAVFKLLGTLLASLVFYRFVPESALMNTLYVSIFAFDLIYVALVAVRFRAVGVNPWTRA